MDAIFLSFANQQSNLLHTLQEEDDTLNRLLSPRFKEQHFLLVRDSFITLEKLPATLMLHRDSLAIFLYSGHADRDSLLLGDGKANSAGIAQMLGQCPNLKLVFLNGCSTEGQVQELLAQGVPVVLATSAPVNDRKATFFSIRFFEALQLQFSLREAFEMAKGAVQAAFQGIELEAHRGVGFSDPKAQTWGLFFSEKTEHLLDWKLPVQAPVQTYKADFVPNQHLIETLFKALGEYNVRIQLLNTQNQGLTKVTPAEKRMAVLNALPAPLAEPLRKLIVPVENQKEGYDKVSEARLHQISQAYNTSMELLVFTMLAQLWQAYYDLGKLDMGDQQHQALRTFFSLSKENREVFDLIELVGTIKSIFDHNHITFFVQELRTVSQLIHTDQEFAESLHFLNGLRLKVRKEKLEAAEVIYLCRRGESSLTYLYSKLGFMARYRLATIQGIDVEKYRHTLKPSYNHAAVILHDLLGGLDLSAVKLDKLLDNRSVLLINDQTWEYLNLSPFVIDENAFHKDTDVCKLFYFAHYLKAPDLLFFKYVYKPDDPLLTIDSEQFHIVREQFDAFADLLLQQPLNTL